eukprot:TRINITY_DN5546_c0_g3_i1.p1 TRINITY_DN5546_c0_g3~~TRINITY_DN5546_c0_g3_i1.p1  ORF type:complete len:283 (+),score=70.28 TRINITY_DN5546_c0_g3_i1:28-876(+)
MCIRDSIRRASRAATMSSKSKDNNTNSPNASNTTNNIVISSSSSSPSSSSSSSSVKGDEQSRSRSITSSSSSSRSSSRSRSSSGENNSNSNSSSGGSNRNSGRMMAVEGSPKIVHLHNSNNNSNNNNNNSSSVSSNNNSNSHHNISIDDYSSFEAHYRSVFAPKSYSGWILVGYSGEKSLTLQEWNVGGSIDQLKALFKDDQIQYAVLRIPLPQGSTRDVFINWMGPSVSAIQKAKKKAFLGEVKELLKPFHAELEALSKQNFTLETVLDRSSPLSGSHVID